MFKNIRDFFSLSWQRETQHQAIVRFLWVIHLPIVELDKGHGDELQHGRVHFGFVNGLLAVTLDPDL